MSVAVEAVRIHIRSAPAGVCPLICGLMPTSIVGGPQPLQARQGREMQRYSQDGARLVAGCIPVRVSEVDGKVDVSVLMITSRGGKGLVFPKGGWEADETVEAAAARETVEEAGVRGTLEEDMVGAFCFKSNKAARKHTAAQGRCVAHMFVMHVAEELPTWPEGAERKRVWCSADKAVELCRHDWMRDALKAWLSKQGITIKSNTEFVS